MMRNLLLAVFLAVSAIASCTSCASNTRHQANVPVVDSEAALRIIMPSSDDLCSGTAIAKHAFLSAAHCFTNTDKNIILNGTPVTIVRILSDNNDHAIVIIDTAFEKWATFGPAVKQGDDIHYWGNAAGLDMLFRKGYVTGGKRNETLFDITGYRGDSGAGAFNSNKQLVAVVSYLLVIPDGAFSLMGAYPFNFSYDQLKAAGLDTSRDPNVLSTLITGEKATLSTK